MLFNLIYPNVCGICEKNIKTKTYACEKCLNILKCYREKYISKCNSSGCDEIISLYAYVGNIRKQICKFKFREGKYIGKTFAYLLSQRVKEIDFDYIIPVPISLKRLMERGFNQSKIITDEMSKMLTKKSLNNVLIKSKNNKRQSELHVKDRKSNVLGAYKVKNEKTIRGKVILLIDDVYTTGSTLNECARTLKRAGAKKVIAVTVAYA